MSSRQSDIFPLVGGFVPPSITRLNDIPESRVFREIGYDPSVEIYGKQIDLLNEQWGIDGTGQTDMAGKFQDIHDYFSAKKVRSVITMPMGSILRVDSPINVDMSYSVFRSDGCIIDGSKIPQSSGYIVKLDGSAGGEDAEIKAMMDFDGWIIRGNVPVHWNGAVSYSIGDMVFLGPFTYVSLVNTNIGHSPPTSGTQWALVSNPAVGLLLDSTGSGHSGAFLANIRRTMVQHCGVGVRIAGFSFSNLFDHLDVSHCGLCLDMPFATESGELPLFLSSSFYNSGAAFSAHNFNGDVNFTGCHFDYNDTFFDINDMRVNLMACHIEGNGDVIQDPPITVAGSGGTLIMHGGTMEFPSAEDICQVNHIMNITTPGGLVEMRGVFEASTQTLTREFATGSGRIIRDAQSGYNTSFVATFSSKTENIVKDPNYVELHPITGSPIIVDDVFLTSTADGIWDAVTDRFTRTGNVSLDITSHHLRAIHTTDVAQFAIVVPLTQEATFANYRVTMDKPGAATGPVFATAGYCTIRNNAHNVPYMTARSNVFGTQTYTFSGVSETGLKVFYTGQGSGTRKPAWATHFFVEINITDLSGGGSIQLYDWLITQS